MIPVNARVTDRRCGVDGWLRPAVRALVVLLIAAVLGACAGGESGGGADPGTAREKVADREESAGARAHAVRAVWAGAVASGSDAEMDGAREELKKLAWKRGAPEAVRVAAFESLFADTRPQGVADTANLLRLWLPTESEYGVLKFACEGIVQRAGQDPVWRQTTSGLVRSWSRVLESPEDDRRPERAALAALYPESAVEETVFAVFVSPTEYGAKPDVEGGVGGTPTNAIGAGTSPPDSAQRIRAAAWDVLARIDPSGERRAVLLRAQGASSTDPALRTLARGASELRVVPRTGSELTWLTAMEGSGDALDRRWWEACASAVAGLDAEQAESLQMRHLEAVRWASAHKADWARASRHELLGELSSRLKDRRAYRIGAMQGADFSMNRNRLNDWEDQLPWGDVLTMLVIDEALADSSVRAELDLQTQGDRADESSEWGGCIYDAEFADGASAGGVSGAGFKAVLYPTRPAHRVNDRTFVASDDMFRRGGRALAHYHFHAQSAQNEEFAGPGAGDREYAQRHNRNCVVLTSVRSGVLNADYYQRAAGPGEYGPTIDLGEIRASVSGGRGKR